jgi:phosphoglycolate phosphatase
MAKDAGMTAVWARYGTRYDARLWDLLVAVTHWTAADVQREAKLREAHRNITPDKTIDTFSDILELVPVKETTLRQTS